MGRLKILTFFGIVISILGGVQSVNSEVSNWAGLLSGVVSGGGCDSLKAQYSCTASKCADKKKFKLCKEICKTNLMIVKHHPNCAAAAGLIKNTGDDEDDNASTSNKCKTLWDRTKKMTRCTEAASAFCEKYGEECQSSEGFSEWCAESCPDKDSEESEGSGSDDGSEPDDNA